MLWASVASIVKEIEFVVISVISIDAVGSFSSSIGSSYGGIGSSFVQPTMAKAIIAIKRLLNRFCVLMVFCSLFYCIF